MKYIKMLFLIFIGIILSFIICSANPLSIEQAVEISIKQNPKIIQASHQLKASYEKISQTKSSYYPQVNITESINMTTNPMWAFGTKLNQENIQGTDFDPAKLNDPETSKNINSTLSVALPIFDSGQTLHNVRQAKLGEKISSLLIEKTKQQVIADTIIAYENLLLAYENLSALKSAIITSNAHLKIVNSRFKNGLSVKSDLLRANVRICSLDQLFLQTESQIEILKSVLNSSMGIPIDTSFELTSRLELKKTINESLEKLSEIGLSNRAELKQIEYQIKIAKEEFSKAKALHLPYVNLFGNYEINTKDLSGSANNYNIGAMMTINLFTGNRISSKEREAKELFNEIEVKKKELTQGILVEIKQAYLSAQSAYKRVCAAKNSIKEAEEALRIVKNRYEEGISNIVDLLDAESTLHKVQTDNLATIHDYNVAFVKLFLACGSINETFK
ncbi:MAG: TolC family protein [Desulfobacterales bacterium]|nr:TolC family protein [Desulfobacterales bacterium]